MSRITKGGGDAPKRRPKKKAGAGGGRLEAILDGLDELYGSDSLDRDAFSTGEPLDGLILTVLSQNTNDRNRDIAYERLRDGRSWDDVASLSDSELIDLIRPAGLCNTKGPRIKKILADVRAEMGAHSLKRLFEWEPSRVREYLTAAEGVGPKTAACVMVFDLMMPAFPVDTHVARVSRRLGIVPERYTPEKIQLFLESVVPPERCAGGHLNMILHGRKICGARKADCPACGISDLCAYNGKEL